MPAVVLLVSLVMGDWEKLYPEMMQQNRNEIILCIQLFERDNRDAIIMSLFHNGFLKNRNGIVFVNYE